MWKSEGGPATTEYKKDESGQDRGGTRENEKSEVARETTDDAKQGRITGDWSGGPELA